MSRDKYNEDCSGCRPVIVDIASGAALPADHPAVRALVKAYDEFGREVHEAWHAITCQNSRDPIHLELVEPMINRMREATAQVSVEESRTNSQVT